MGLQKFPLWQSSQHISGRIPFHHPPLEDGKALNRAWYKRNACTLRRIFFHRGSFSLLKKNFFFLIFLLQGIGILVSKPGVKPASPSLSAGNLNHWTTREVPASLICPKALRGANGVSERKRMPACTLHMLFLTSECRVWGRENHFSLHPSSF